MRQKDKTNITEGGKIRNYEGGEGEEREGGGEGGGGGGEGTHLAWLLRWDGQVN